MENNRRTIHVFKSEIKMIELNILNLFFKILQKLLVPSFRPPPTSPTLRPSPSLKEMSSLVNEPYGIVLLNGLSMKSSMQVMMRNSR